MLIPRWFSIKPPMHYMIAWPSSSVIQKCYLEGLSSICIYLFVTRNHCLQAIKNLLLRNVFLLALVRPFSVVICTLVHYK